MISFNDIAKVGRTQKPHGIKGEINVVFQKPEYADIDTDFYFLEIDGIPVPFFVEEFTYSTDVAARVKFEDVSDETKASAYANLNVYLPVEEVRKSHRGDEPSWDFFIGYSIVSESEHLGTIENVDDSTLNVLFIVKNDDNELLIPATEDFIVNIDEEKRVITMNLPEGLIDHD